MSTGLFRSKQFKSKKDLRHIVISGPLNNTDLQQQQQQQQQRQISAPAEDLRQQQPQKSPPIRRRLSGLVSTSSSSPTPSTKHHPTYYSILHKSHHHKNGKHAADNVPRSNYDVYDPLQIILVSKYAFAAESPRELSIKPKQFLRFLEKCGNGWLKVCDLENNSQLGLVPASYLDIAINDITRPITLEWLHEFKTDTQPSRNNKMQTPTDCLIDEIYQDTTTKRIWFCVKMQYDFEIVYANRSFKDFVNLNNRLLNHGLELPEWTSTESTKINSAVIQDLKLVCVGLNQYLQTIVKQAGEVKGGCKNTLQQHLHAFIFDLGMYTIFGKEQDINEAVQHDLFSHSILIDKVTPAATRHEFDLISKASLPWQKSHLEQQHQQPQKSQQPPHRRKSEQLFSTPGKPVYNYEESAQSHNTAKTTTEPTFRKSFRHSTTPTATATATATATSPQSHQRARHQSNYTYSPSQSPSSVASITSTSRRLVKSRTTSRVFKIPDQPELEAITSGKSCVDSIPQSISSNTLLSYTSLFDQYEGGEEDEEEEEETKEADKNHGNEARDSSSVSGGTQKEPSELGLADLIIHEHKVDTSDNSSSHITAHLPHHSHDSSQSHSSSHNSSYFKINRRTDSTSNSSVDSHRLSVDAKETSMDNNHHSKLAHVSEHQQDSDCTGSNKDKYKIEPLVVRPIELPHAHSDACFMDLCYNGHHLEDTRDASLFSTAPNTPITPTTLVAEMFAMHDPMSFDKLDELEKFGKPSAHPPNYQRKLSSANVTQPLQQVYSREWDMTTTPKSKPYSNDELDDEIKPLNVKKKAWAKKTDNLTQLEPMEPEAQYITKTRQNHPHSQQQQVPEYIKLKIFLQNSSNDVIVLRINRNKLTSINYVKSKLSNKIYHDAKLIHHYKLMPLLLHGDEEKKTKWGNDDEVLLKYIKKKAKCNLKLVRKISNTRAQ
ncbi:hypothetical protein CANMA_002177 [Candida margitis]|uniref:uncharacterized protein n=1 Tax=Candida margitis TaxID=1775924 RepID=UPI002227C53E|nr:uncharacterized protein CANMA_002177 [Candida margitis]KAI5968741.1 hypothetical protein CANMA_002177 [Candida margitis]